MEAERQPHGPPRLHASNMDIQAGQAATIAQTGCWLEVDGVPAPTQEIDIEASYAEGVLGKSK